VTGKVTLKLDSPIGPLDVTLSERAVHRIDFGGAAPESPVPRSVRPLLQELRNQLGEYFAGKRRRFDVPVEPDPPGTDFQRSIWAALLEVPYGEVVSCGDLAAWAGRAKAGRAAGLACGANRVPILIPCHRVVAKNGLGGFGGGLAVKKALLKLEHR
jgi:methylated-DNA-[protein]-cysteine S-methyltransferase